MHVIDEQTRRFGRLLHYAGVLLTVICASTGYSFLHAPAVHEIAETSAKIDELLQSVRNGPVMRQQHQIESEKLRTVKTRIANLQQRVPPEPDGGEFLNEVTKLAADGHVSIKDFHPEKSETKAGYAEMQVTLRGQGSFASICHFIDQLSKLTRLSKIKDLNLTAGDDSTEYPMTATLVIYFGLRGSETAKPQEGRSG